MSIRKQAIALAVAAAFQSPLVAQTLPTGGAVAAGSAMITESPGNLFVSQGSDKAVINWQSFSIGAGGTVSFSQPSSSSIALNRVLGNNPSDIYGNLFANGRVFLVNPSGIYFAPGAQVSVGGLVASTLSITDDDFLAGRYVFSNAGGARGVVNQGSINSFSGYTALLAPQVTNEGFIWANMGSVALAAGDRVSLDMVGDNLIRVSVDQAALDAAVANTGNIEAFGGNVLMSAKSANALLDTVLNTQGLVRASSMTMVDGEIVLDGGSRGAMTIGGQVTSDGHMTIAGADITVTGYAWSMRGQDVAARSLSVIGRDGAVASLSNQGGEQVIAIAGDGSSAGLDLIADGGLAAQIQQFDAAYAQIITVLDADHINIDGRTAGPGPFPAVAGIFTPGAQSIAIAGTGRNAISLGGDGSTGTAGIGGGAQSISASSLRLQGGVGAANSGAFISGFGQTIEVGGDITVAGGSGSGNGAGIFGSGFQSISAANLGLQGGFGGENSGAFVNGAGQNIEVSGEIAVSGGSGSFNGAGIHSIGALQSISTSNLRLQGAFGGDNSGAFVNGGGQSIDVSGEIVIAGGSGTNNGAGINSTGVQTILGRPDIAVTSGVSNFATINAGPGALQTIEAHDIRLSNSTGPGNSASVIQGTHQQIDATGDVTLSAHAATGDLAGARIGGATGSSTDLHLRLDGNLVLTGGSAGLNGVGLGGSVAPTAPALETDIAVVAGGDVILDGASSGGGVRIGSNPRRGIAGGDISITAASIRFMGDAPAAIHTLENVALDAAEIAQGPNSVIQAGSLVTESTGPTSLAGLNQVARYSGTSWAGDLALNNVVALEVTGLNAANASLTNAGPVMVSGAWNTMGDTGITTTGEGADLDVIGSVFASGAMDLNVAGTLNVTGSGSFAFLGSAGAQTIHAGALAVTAENGGSAVLHSASDQSVAVAGGNIDVAGAFGGFASIEGANQAISVVDGDYVRIAGDTDGFAQILSIEGTQTVALTGSGENAVVVGRQGGSGFSTLNAATQRLTAGLEGQSGSITVLGPDAGMVPFATIAARGEGGQTVSTSGKISILGGSATFGGGTVGFFNDGPGQQTVGAGSIELRGGPGGSGPGVFLNSNGGGDQVIDVAGSIEVIGGTGRNAGIGVNPFFSTRQAKQTISAASIRIAGGPGGNASISSNTGGEQIVVASGDIELTNAEDSPVNSAGVILGSHQRISAGGHVLLTAKSATGGASGVRIGGPGAGASDLELAVGGNLVLTGGTTGTNGAGLGGAGSGATSTNDISVTAAGDVVLDGAVGGGGARIGNSALTGLTDGKISVRARSILFTGAAPAAIRTLGNVTLSAGDIQQGANGLILGDALATHSTGATILGGSNAVSSFTGFAGGDLALKNTSSLLTLGPVDALGALDIDQAGSLLIQAADAPLWVRGGMVSVATGGDVRLVGGSASGAEAVLSGVTSVDLTVGGTLRLDEGSGKFAWARIQTESKDGTVRLAFPNLSSGGFYVNGVEGDTKDGKSGFFIFHKPAKIGRDLFVDYGN
jgi:filamentous hemagglutinin family protein